MGSVTPNSKLLTPIMNKTRLIAILFGMMMPFVLLAANIDEDEARQRALGFMQQLRPGTPVSATLAFIQPSSIAPQPRALAPSHPYTPAPSLYVFNLEQQGGFVIVSGDDRTLPILGYSDSGSFDEQTMPEALKMWLEAYAEQIAQLDFFMIDADPTTTVQGSSALSANAPSRQNIAPLLKSKWDQEAPYNFSCPMDPRYNELSLTGCVATAMSQVMYYYKYPQKTSTTIPKYITETTQTEMPAIPPTTIDWANMQNIYSPATTDKQDPHNKAVAQLMLLAGCSVEMNYRSTSSGAATAEAPQALYNYFGYDAGMRNVSRISYTESAWDELLYNELRNHRPVIYSGRRCKNGNDDGHAFLIDGYATTGYFHVNWGWGGSHNGYFLLSVLAPDETSDIGKVYSSVAYSFDQAAVIGIQPDAGGQPEPARMASYGAGITLGDENGTYQRSAATADFPPVNITSEFYNFTGQTNTFDCAVGLYDNSGNLKATATLCNNREFRPNYGFSGINTSFAFGKNLPNGTYRILNISRESGTSQWQQNKYSEIFYLVATINGNKLTVQKPTVNLAATINTDDEAEVGRLVKFDAILQNNGTYFNDVVYLLVNGQRIGGRVIQMEAGANANMKIGFVPTTTGRNTIQLATIEGKDYSPFADYTIDVAPASSNNLTLSVASTNAASDNTVGTTLKITVNAKNNASSPYYNLLCLKLYKLRDDNSGYGDLADQQDQYVNINSKGNANTTFTFTDLQVGAEYFGYVYYVSNGSISNQTRAYIGSYRVVNTATDIPGIEDDSKGVYNGTPSHSIYDLQGRRIGNVSPLKKGIYIIGGKKVIR